MIGELYLRLSDEVQRIWCYRWLVPLVAVTLFAAAAVFIVRQPDVYDAWGQIYVNKQTPLAVAAEGVAATGDGYGSPYVVQKTLMNDQNLVSVVKKINPAMTHASAQELARATAQLRKRVRVVPDGGDGFVEFHYTDANPKRASTVVDALLTQFISGSIDRSHRDLGRAETFLDEQVATYGGLVAQSQAKLIAMRRRFPGLTPAPRVLGGEAVAAGAAPSITTPATPARPSAVAERLAGLEARLTSLRAVYTDQYPDVVSVRRQIADAAAERERERRLAPPPAGEPSAGGSARASRRFVARARSATSPAAPPAMTAEWTDAQRSDEALRARLSQLISRRDAARMSQAVYGPDGSGKFEITREPVEPFVASGPRREMQLLISALAALAAGLGAAYLRAGMRGLVVSPRELQLACQLPVIGTVSRAPAWRTRHRRPDEPVPGLAARPALRPVAPLSFAGEPSGKGFR